MTDKELCRAVAELWVKNGGDYEGFNWCISMILDAIAEVEDEQIEDALEGRR